MEKKNIRFSFEASPANIPAWFDADKIDKIMFNLLSNACKYTPENGAIDVRLEEERNHVKISVKNSGEGIAEEDLKEIFTLFYTNKMKRAGDSNGIGLSLAKNLAELHRGTISAQSENGAGAVFTVEIPADKESYDTELIENGDVIFRENSENQSGFNENKISSEQGATLLLTEDNEELLALMEKMTSVHYRVLTAKNGTQALQTVEREPVDIIVSDVMMLETDGLELTRKLKNNLETSHIPVILLTAKNAPEDRVQCYEAGADGYISKPFELKVLLARISNLLANKREKQNKFKKDAEINISTLEYPDIDAQFLDHAVKIIEENLAEPDFDTAALSDRLNISKSTLYRKIKSMTDFSPSEFIRNVRLKHACKMLKTPSVRVSDVAYAVGFQDAKYFSQCFKSEFGKTPKDFQKE